MTEQNTASNWRFSLACILFVLAPVLTGCDQNETARNRAERMKPKVLAELYETALHDGTRCVVIGDYRAYAAITCDWRH